MTDEEYIQGQYRTVPRTRKEKILDWISRHQDGVIIGSTIAVLIGGMVFLVKVDAKYAAKRAEEQKRLIASLNGAVDAQRKIGLAVYPVNDAS